MRKIYIYIYLSACASCCACLCGCISSSRAAQGNTDLCKYLARALCFIASRPAKTFCSAKPRPTYRRSCDRPKIFNYFSLLLSSASSLSSFYDPAGYRDCLTADHPVVWTVKKKSKLRLISLILSLYNCKIIGYGDIVFIGIRTQRDDCRVNFQMYLNLGASICRVTIFIKKRRLSFLFNKKK